MVKKPPFFKLNLLFSPSMKNKQMKFFLFFSPANESTSTSTAAVETVIPVVPVLTAPFADLRLASIHNENSPCFFLSSLE